MSSGGDLQYLEQNGVVSLFTHRRNRKRITSHVFISFSGHLISSIQVALLIWFFPESLSCMSAI